MCCRAKFLIPRSWRVEAAILKSHAPRLKFAAPTNSQEDIGAHNPMLHKNSCLINKCFNESKLCRKFLCLTAWQIATDTHTFAHLPSNEFVSNLCANGWIAERSSHAIDHFRIASIPCICRKHERNMLRVLSQLINVSTSIAHSASAT